MLCAYPRRGPAFISIYVDDITIFAPPSAFRQKVKGALKSEFDCKDLDDVRYILGLEVNNTDRGIELSQCGYIEEVLLKYGMIDCHPVSIPLDPNSPLRKSEPGTGVDNINEYQSMIGSLMYAVIGTRPDLAHTVTVLSQFSSSPNQIYLQAAKRTLRYLKGTMDWKLLYPKAQNDSIGLMCYSDASYGSSLDDRRSYSGYIILLGGVYVFYLISRCMQPEGPWQRLAVALAESSAFLTPPTKRPDPVPNHCGLYWGNPFSSFPRPPNKREKAAKRQRKGTKEKYILGRARPVVLALLPRDLISIPAFVRPGPGHLCRRSTPHPRILQKLYHRSDGVILPQAPQRWRPRVLPPAILSHSLPQPPDMGGPRLALRKQVMPRLSPSTTAPPPALVRPQPLGA